MFSSLDALCVGDEKSTINANDVIPMNVESHEMTREDTKVKSTSGIGRSGETAIMGMAKRKPKDVPSQEPKVNHHKKTVRFDTIN